MGNFEQKINKFMEIFLEQKGYVKVRGRSAKYFDDCRSRFNRRYFDWYSDCYGQSPSKI